MVFGPQLHMKFQRDLICAKFRKSEILVMFKNTTPKLAVRSTQVQDSSFGPLFLK